MLLYTTSAANQVSGFQPESEPLSSSPSSSPSCVCMLSISWSRWRFSSFAVSGQQGALHASTSLCSHCRLSGSTLSCCSCLKGWKHWDMRKLWGREHTCPTAGIQHFLWTLLLCFHCCTNLSTSETCYTKGSTSESVTFNTVYHNTGTLREETEQDNHDSVRWICVRLSRSEFSHMNGGMQSWSGCVAGDSLHLNHSQGLCLDEGACRGSPHTGPLAAIFTSTAEHLSLYWGPASLKIQDLHLHKHRVSILLISISIFYSR